MAPLFSHCIHNSHKASGVLAKTLHLSTALDEELLKGGKLELQFGASLSPSTATVASAGTSICWKDLPQPLQEEVPPTAIPTPIPAAGGESNKWLNVPWKKLQVGDIVRVMSTIVKLWDLTLVFTRNQFRKTHS
nr:hypothetical protein Iba_chr11bCG0600 [Ipomoea batatas]